MIKAINSKHQVTVNKFLKFNALYDDLVNQELEESLKGERAYSKASDAWLSLPKREQANITKQLPNVIGCY